MENKYYTPTIEELHVGFEFETNDPMIMGALGSGKKFDCFTISEESFWGGYDGETEMMNIVSALRKNDTKQIIRVKYLDQEDIESLGWHFTLDEGAFKAYHFERWQLLFFKEHIEIANYNKYEGCSFMGTIRNKSELKQIMRMVGITAS